MDIFFVISGYLITSILMNDIEKGRFSLARFYSRRIRRIFPALIVVLLFCLVVGYWILFRREFDALAKHVAASAIFIENFLLWSESGYFDAASETKPLLHLWSLAIEEQFYIVWPIFLFACRRSGARSLMLIVAVALVSFVHGLYLSWHDVAAAYYSPIGRFWELMVGSALAHVAFHKPELLARHGNYRSIAGLAAIVVGLALINEARYFPGWWALLPTGGALLLISAGPAAWINRVLLSSRPFVWCGLISYPLYLWHWPLLTFLNLVSTTHGYKGRIAVLLLSVVLAALTYWLVERFFRARANAAGGVRKPAWLLVSMASLCAVAVTIHAVQFEPRLKIDLPERSEWDYLIASNQVKGSNLVGIYKLHSERPRSTLFIGDSHLAQYAERINYVEDHETSANAAVMALGGACIPIDQVRSDDLRFAECWDARRRWLDMAADPSIDTIVFGAHWSWYFYDSRFYFEDKGVAAPLTSANGRQLALAMLGTEFRNAIASGKRVFLVLDNPTGIDFDPFADAERFSLDYGKDPDELVDVEPEQMAIREQLLALARRSGAHVIDPADTLCSQAGCRWATASGMPIYKDDNHLNPDWAIRDAGFIDRTVEPAAATPSPG